LIVACDQWFERLSQALPEGSDPEAEFGLRLDVERGALLLSEKGFHPAFAGSVWHKRSLRRHTTQ